MRPMAKGSLHRFERLEEISKKEKSSHPSRKGISYPWLSVLNRERKKIGNCEK